MERFVGRILFFKTSKNYGFLRRSDGQQFFVHGSEWQGFLTPEQNSFVTFALKRSLVAGKPEECADVRPANNAEVAVAVEAVKTASRVTK
jgi:cold shock CspA family protein